MYEFPYRGGKKENRHIDKRQSNVLIYSVDCNEDLSPRYIYLRINSYLLRL